MDEQLEKLKKQLPEIEGSNEDELLLSLLESSKDIIFENRFPYKKYPEKLEQRYLGLQIRIAKELYSKMGAEGEKSHSEAGVNRSWSSADVSVELISLIIPYVGTI